MKTPAQRKAAGQRHGKIKKSAKPSPQICGGCADNIPYGHTAGSGGCVTCRDGIPRCDACHETHTMGCFEEDNR